MTDVIIRDAARIFFSKETRANTVLPVAGPRFAVEATYGMYAARVVCHDF